MQAKWNEPGALAIYGILGAIGAGLVYVLYQTGKEVRGAYASLNPADEPEQDEPPEELQKHWVVERASGTGEHTISSAKSPKAQVLGLHTTEAHPVDGWNGIFVGDADDWIPVMVRDGYWNDAAWVYEIDFDALAAAGHDYWIMEDPNVVDKTETPSSFLVLTKDDVIPAFAVKLTRRISAKECEKMYEETFGSEDSEDEESYDGPM